MEELRKKIVIAGAGASGMMAGIFAAGELGDGSGVLILEKNDKAGRKLLATGNGRCNFTNAKSTSWDYSGAFLQRKETSGFPDGVMYQAPPKHIMEVFFKMGILPRIEEEGRVYPYSGQGASVCQALSAQLEGMGVELRFKSVLKKAERSSEGFRLELSDGTKILCEALVLAVGGKAGCQYGSEGDGYALARGFGHSIVKPIPALVQLTTEDKSFPRLKGVRAKAKVTLYEGERKLKEDKGEVQFTENGLSGICIFNLSRYVRYSGNPMNSTEKYTVRIDFIDDYPSEGILAFLRIRQEDIGSRPASSFLDGILHEKLAAVFLSRAGIRAEKAVSGLNEDELISLARELKGFEVKIAGTKSWKDAQVTAGGVDTSEIDRKTMESKLVSGLYFAGELIDVDAPCGGYNLQWAFASGLVAGRAAAGGRNETE